MSPDEGKSLLWLERLSRLNCSTSQGIQVLHDMILLSGGPEKMSVEFVAEHWKKVPNDVIANPPKGGSKGYQDELAKNILREMFGKDFAELLSAANRRQFDVLKGEGATV